MDSDSNAASIRAVDRLDPRLPGAMCERGNG